VNERPSAAGRLGRVANLVIGLLAIAAIAVALWRLESASSGLIVEQTRAGSTPVTRYRLASGAPAPVVIVAHGFAGSRQLMQPFALTLARNGYCVLSFDFPGHGRNPDPFVARIEDQERRIEVLTRALEATAGLALASPCSDGRMALLGHSMAGDVLVRYAATHRDRVEATVLLSPYLAEDAPTGEPRNLLIIYGSLEPEMLHQMGREAIAATSGGRVEAGVVYGDPAAGTARMLVLADGAEHIGVLFGRAGLTAALDWLDRSFRPDLGTDADAFIDARGPALGLLFLGILALAWPLSRLLPRVSDRPLGAGLGWRRLWPVAVAPAVLTPLILRLIPTNYLPILLGDYLALHFGVYGLVTAIGLALVRRRDTSALPDQSRDASRGTPLLIATLAASAYAILVIALAVDRYVTAFIPGAERLLILLAIVPGTWAYFVADGWLTHGAGSPRVAPAVTKLLFLLSLLLAVALNLNELFFLIIIVPAILVFFLVYGLIGGWVYRQTRHPLPGALAIGLAFAWAIAATFPLVGA
jgi:pimeloyl-ACP methyl ester carboxylesterase